MSFSAKRWAYCPRPSFSSQSATCCMEAAYRISGSSARIGNSTRQTRGAVGKGFRTCNLVVKIRHSNSSALSHINKLSAVEPVLDVKFDLLERV